MDERDKARFRALTDKYELSKEDYFFSPQGWIIINRPGIYKIQASMGLKVRFELIEGLCDLERKVVVIKAIAEIKELGNTIESYGETNEKNLKGGAGSYPIAMAEKRALSRVVLKASGFYQIAGILGEDETTSDEHDVPGKPTQGLQRLACSPATRKK